MQKKYQEDLEEFLKLTKTKRGIAIDKDNPLEYWHLNFYQLHSEEELNNFIKNLNLEEKELDDYTFNYYVNVIIKYMSGNLDSHTNLRLSNTTVLPYRLKYFPHSGLYLKDSSDKRFVKAKILKINNIPIDDLIFYYEKRASYGCLNHLYQLIEKDFTILEMLYSLPNFPRLDDILILETDKGILKVSLANNLVLQDEVEEDYYIKDKTLIFNYKSCQPYYIPVIEKLIKELNTLLANSSINRFVLDLRNNGGGASGIIKPLIEYLQDKNLELITIVNGGVFSIGRFAAIDMKMIGSKIIGEAIGTPINCFGNILKPPVLKNTNQQPIFAKTYWHLNYNKQKMMGIAKRVELIKQPKNFFEPQFLELDEEIEETLDDFMSNYDRALEIALTNSLKMK